MDHERNRVIPFPPYGLGSPSFIHHIPPKVIKDCYSNKVYFELKTFRLTSMLLGGSLNITASDDDI